jgi:two-component system, OmpR family, sensor histidine kinase KdpD
VTGVPLIVLVALETTSPKEGSTSQRITENLSFALVFTLLGIVFAVLVARRLAGPLVQISGAADALSHGYPATIPGDTGSSEIVELSHSVARMAQALGNQKMQIETQANKLQEANLIKDEFLGIVSHELKNPLAVIYGSSLILLRKRKELSEENLNELVSGVVSEAERAEKLIDDLLLLARMELGTAVPLEPIPLTSAIEPAVRLFNQARPERKVIIDTLEDDLGVMGNEVYLVQVLINLMSNADKYSPRLEPIELRARLHGSQVVLTVRDHGPGVRADELDRMFETFYRSERTARLAPGKGLGLTVCKRLVQAMGGSVWASLPSDGGLEVNFRLNRDSQP